MRAHSRVNAAVSILALLLSAGAAPGQNCTATSTGRIPIMDMGAGLYLGQFPGGLYPGSSNEMPPAHHAAGMARSMLVVPRNAAGQPHPEGRIVMISIGMSNTTQEFCGGSNNNCAAYSFIGQSAAHPGVNHSTLAILDGAAGGQTAAAWEQPGQPNYVRILENVLMPRGLTEAQVQVAWVKVANPGPNRSLPDANADAYRLFEQCGNIARALKARYPNMQQVFFSTRIYAGYATTTLNPEPYAYENGFSVKWLIESQIAQAAGGPPHPLAGDLRYDGAGAPAPWMAWGPYLWADGLVPRSDGLVWQCADFNTDGTHPSPSGRGKVGTLLLDFFLSAPESAAWFRGSGPALCYANCDGSTAEPVLNIDDFTCFVNRFASGRSLPHAQQVTHYANCDGSTVAPALNIDDFTCFVDAFALGCR